jgi:hypothetical protein
MASFVRRRARDDDHVAFADADLVVAARAAVRLQCFIRLDAPYDDLVFVVVGPLVLGHTETLRAGVAQSLHRRV